MSFFGFDTTMPRDRLAGGSGRAGAAKQGPGRFDEVGDQTADPFDPTNGAGSYDDGMDDDALDAAFEEKLRGLRAAGREDLEIYTWGGAGDGGERNDGLGDLLDEAGDDFNEDTFGVDDVGRDFDFGTAGDQHLELQKAQPQLGGAAAPMQKPSPWAARAADPFASTMDDFWQMPDVAPKRSAPGHQHQQQQQQQQQQEITPVPSLLPQHDVFAQAQAPPKTLEEIEAELRAQQSRQHGEVQSQDQSSADTAPSGQRRQMTLEEVEADLRAKRAGQQQATGPQPSDAFPPLGSQPLPPVPQQAPAQPLPPVPGMPPPHDQSPAAQFARMQALLQALPNPIQARILALPPYMHFGITSNISREFPALLVAANREKLPQQVESPMLWPRIDGGPEQQNAIRFMVDTALARIDDAYRAESKRQIRITKIQAMAGRNNLMSRSDKDFITRIQVSQLITPNPYADDFYAHIYFALHGNNSRAVLPKAAAEDGMSGALQQQKNETANSADAAVVEAGDSIKKQRQRKHQQQQHNRREQAMLRMQQQMERIVQGRKERIEKATGSAALEGALGRVSLGSTKAPRQLLQIGQQDGAATPKADGTDLSDDAVGSGHARDAVRQALQGASLAHGTSGQTRPALTKHEALLILEGLYDSVLALEQSRRSAPSGATEDSQDAASVEWRAQQEQLTNHVWTELRVLEPLEISDPHPFISLMSTVKGKRLLPRVLRHLSNEQALTAMTMIVASFDKLDVVRDAPLLDEAHSSNRSSQVQERRSDAKRQSEAFVTSIVPSMYSVIAGVPLRIVSGMLALFIERNNPVRASQSKAGAAFLTIFLSRGATLRQAATVASTHSAPAPAMPDAAELAQWKEIFQLLIQRLAQPPSTLTTLFPSTRAKARLPFGMPGLDAQRKEELEVEDRDVWQLMATIAVGSDMQQQQILVTGLRDKILENVLEAKQWSQANPAAALGGEGDLRIRNVNLLLHALNLDATQITV